MRKKSLAKPFTFAGFVAGELYMLYTALAPNLKGAVVPWEGMVQRCLALALFFGPFGAAVGVGLWLLVEAIRQTFTVRDVTEYAEETPKENASTDAAPPGQEKR